MYSSVIEAMEAGRAKSRQHRENKVKNIERKVKSSDGPISVEAFLAAVSSYSSDEGILLMFKATGKAKGQLKQFMASWECPLVLQTDILEFMRISLQYWGAYCSSRHNFRACPSGVFDLNSVLDYPKWWRSYSMFLNGMLENEREVTGEYLAEEQRTKKHKENRDATESKVTLKFY